MRQLLFVALLFSAAEVPAAEPTCAAVAEAVRVACEASAPRERRGSERCQFSEDLCRTATRVARRACDRGVHRAHDAGACRHEAEYTGDVMVEACRPVLYRNPRPSVKVGFKFYDERCRRHARAAEEESLRSACGPSRGEAAGR